MAEEIERKFLVCDDSWRSGVRRSERYRQGYLAVTDRCGVRVRVEGEWAQLNVKSAGLDIRRLEYDYTIPVADAERMLSEFCGSRQLAKTRHFLTHAGHTWEIDEFEGENHGLVVAEIELNAVDEAFARPDWLGEEVSGDPRYLNSYLAEHPFARWPRR